MKIPGSFTLSGNISSSGSFTVSATVVMGPWSGEIDPGLCTAWYSASANLTVTLTSVRDPGVPAFFGIKATADADVGAGCGAYGVTIGLRANFDYTAPATFSLLLQLRFNFAGVGSWNPTVFKA
jgi:hypothetical protein